MSQSSVDQLRSEYRQLRETASRVVSSAVSRSNQVFTETCAAPLPNVRAPLLDPMQMLNPQSPPVVARPACVLEVVSVPRNKRGDHLFVTEPSVPVMGVDSDPKPVFLTMLEELCKIDNKPIPPKTIRLSLPTIGKSAGSMSSRNISCISEQTPTSVKARPVKKPSVVSFGSSLPRFGRADPSENQHRTKRRIESSQQKSRFSIHSSGG